MGCKGDLSVNLCERYVFGGSFQCGPMQYYERRTLISNLVYVSSSIIYGIAAKPEILKLSIALKT